MQCTDATVLNTLVSVPRFVVVNGDTLDGIDRLDYGKIFDEVIVHLSGGAIDQTSVKYAIAAGAVNDARPRTTVA